MDFAPTASSFNIEGPHGAIPCRAWGSAAHSHSAVVLVHGLNSHGGWFEPASRQFELNDIYAVAYDQIGFGQRKSQAIQSYDNWLQDLEAVFSYVRRQMGDTRPVFLLGNSLGGLISALAVGSGKDKLNPAGLILLAPGFAGNPKSFTTAFTLKTMAKAVVNPAWGISEPINIEQISRSPEAQEWILKETGVQMQVPAGVFFQIYLLTKNAPRKITSIGCPLLMLTAQHDSIVDNQTSMQVFKKFKSKTKIHKEFADAYHDLLLDPLYEDVTTDIIQWMHTCTIPETLNSIPAMFFDRASSMGGATALLYKDGSVEFNHMTWNDFSQLCTNIAFGLLDMGVSLQEPVVIFAANSYKWIACDLGILLAGGVSVPVYPTSCAQDVDYILSNCEASVAFVHGNTQLGKLLSSSSPRLKKIVILDRSFEHDKQKLDSSCISFDELVAAGAGLACKSPELLKQRLSSIKRDDLATLVYTSGTTGTPKGAMLTHGNILSVITDIAPIIPIGLHEVYLSYLPLSHVLERVAGEFYWIHSGGIFAIAESIEKFLRDFSQVQPSMLLVVPRILDRIHTKVVNGIKQAPFTTRLLARWALSVGNKVVETRGSGQQLSSWLKFQHYMADMIVLRRLRHKIGDRLKLIVSGSAPALPEVMRFFNAVGICTLEGYGLTETAAPVTVNRPDKVKIGTVGQALNSVELKLAPDGEILVRGPSIFAGYYKNDVETSGAFEDSWFRTGDIGKIDAQGYLTITDRKKDILVNAAGKNIAPLRIEAVLNEIPVVLQSVVFGDRQKSLVALFTLDESSTMELASERGWPVTDFEQLCRSKELNQYLRLQIKSRNQGLADYEKIRQFAVLPRNLSIEEGELTPTMKVKRAVVAERYRDLINSLYQETDSLVAAAN